MFLTNRKRGYNRADEQFTHGYFLIVASERSAERPYPDTYACVRFVRYRQLGHFMMGSARVGPDRIVLSGAYGNDSLPIHFENVSQAARARFTRLTDVETAAFWESETDPASLATIRAGGKRLLAAHTKNRNGER